MSYSFHNPKLPQNVDNFNPVDNFKTLFKEYPREFAKTFPVMTKHFKSQPWSGMIPRGKKAKVEEQPPTTLEEVPGDILGEILSFFQDPIILGNLSLTSKNFYERLKVLFQSFGAAFRTFLFSNVDVSETPYLLPQDNNYNNYFPPMTPEEFYTLDPNHDVNRHLRSNLLFNYMNMSKNRQSHYLRRVQHLLLYVEDNLKYLGESMFEIRRAQLCKRDFTPRPKSIKFYLEQFANLKELRLENCLITRLYKNVSFKPKLTKLTLVSCHRFGKVEEFESLKHLTVSNCDQITEFSSFPELRHLRVFRCIRITELPKFPKLRSLTVALSAKLSKLPSFPELRQLRLDRCIEITKLPKLPKLTHLKLSFCPHIRGLDNTKFSKLTSLEVEECLGINEIPHFKELVDLEVCFCPITKIVHYPKLIDLRVERCPELREIEGQNELTHFGVANCQYVTEVKNFPKLTHLRVEDDRTKFTPEDMPMLTSLYYSGKNFSLKTPIPKLTYLTLEILPLPQGSREEVYEASTLRITQIKDALFEKLPELTHFSLRYSYASFWFGGPGYTPGGSYPLVDTEFINELFELNNLRQAWNKTKLSHLSLSFDWDFSYVDTDVAALPYSRPKYMYLADHFRPTSPRYDLTLDDYKGKLTGLSKYLGYPITGYCSSDDDDEPPELEIPPLKISESNHLKSLVVKNSKNLQEISNMGPYLRSLVVEECEFLQKISDCPGLDILKVSYSGIQKISGMVNLKKLVVKSCKSLKKISLEFLSLEELKVSDCRELEISHLKKLKKLKVRRTPVLLKDLPSLPLLDIDKSSRFYIVSHQKSKFNIVPLEIKVKVAPCRDKVY